MLLAPRLRFAVLLALRLVENFGWGPGSLASRTSLRLRARALMRVGSYRTQVAKWVRDYPVRLLTFVLRFGSCRSWPARRNYGGGVRFAPRLGFTASGRVAHGRLVAITGRGGSRRHVAGSSLPLCASGQRQARRFDEGVGCCSSLALTASGLARTVQARRSLDLGGSVYRAPRLRFAD